MYVCDVQGSLSLVCKDEEMDYVMYRDGVSHGLTTNELPEDGQQQQSGLQHQHGQRRLLRLRGPGHRQNAAHRNGRGSARVLHQVCRTSVCNSIRASRCASERERKRKRK